MRHKLTVALARFQEDFAGPESDEWGALSAALGRVLDTDDGWDVFGVIWQYIDPFASAYTGNSDTYYQSALQDLGKFLVQVLSLRRPDLITSILTANRPQTLPTTEDN